jgi:O-antigen/teichoic acid export membrane protein
MMTAIPHETDEALRQNLLSGFFGCALVLSFVTLTVIELVTYILGTLVPTLHLGANALPLALTILGFQLQDWLRKALYAQHKNVLVIYLDSLAYGGHVLGIILLYVLKLLTPANALLMLATAFFVASLVMLVFQKISLSFRQVKSTFFAHWRDGRDYFIAWQLQWAGSQGLALFGGGILGPHIVGALRASTNLVQPVNVIFQWLENVIPVRAVTHLKKGGLLAMYKFLTKLAKIGGLLFGVVVIGLYFFAEPLLGTIYGDAYRPYAFFVFLQAIYLWLGHFYRLELYACRATQKTAEIARASLIMALVAITAGVAGMYWIGGNAIILALILGQSISHLYLYLRREKGMNLST